VRLPTSGAPLQAGAINSYALLTLVFNAMSPISRAIFGMLAHHRLHPKGFL
jgi:hypothetical protein